jgi:hypothetical protein
MRQKESKNNLSAWTKSGGHKLLSDNEEESVLMF